MRPAGEPASGRESGPDDEVGANDTARGHLQSGRTFRTELSQGKSRDVCPELRPKMAELFSLPNATWTLRPLAGWRQSW